jgi:AraC-like DNA-binding protein
VINVDDLLETPAVVVERHRSDDMTWETAVATPPPSLRGIVGDYAGYEEHIAGALARREVPHGGVVLILNLGDPMDIGPADPADGPARAFGSFVAGLHEIPVRTEFVKCERGIQVNLPPLGARRLLGLPMHELANRVVDLDSLPVAQVAELTERLGATDDWSGRFSILDQFLGAWSATGGDVAVDPAVTWAWRQIVGSHGRVSVADLAGEIGWSRRHFGDRFRQQVGLAPKAMARVVRFQRAAGMVAADDGRSITDIASLCGFADHSHLVRDFQSLGGCTPTQYRAAQLAGATGVGA